MEDNSLIQISFSYEPASHQKNKSQIRNQLSQGQMSDEYLGAQGLSKKDQKALEEEMKKLRRTIDLLLTPVREKDHAMRVRSMLENVSERSFLSFLLTSHPQIRALDLSTGGAHCATEIVLVDARRSYGYVTYAQGSMYSLFARQNPDKLLANLARYGKICVVFNKLR